MVRYQVVQLVRVAQGEPGRRDGAQVKPDPRPCAARDLDVAGDAVVPALHDDLTGQHGELKPAVIPGVARVHPLTAHVAAGELAVDLVAERALPSLAARL